MNGLWRELLVIGVALGGVWMGAEVAGDGGTLVSPPEVVAEQFVASAVRGRYRPARTRLGPPLDLRLTGDSLRTFSRTIEARLGRVTAVEGEASSRLSDHSVVAVVRLTAAGGHRAGLLVTLQRPGAGRPWKVTAVGPW